MGYPVKLTPRAERDLTAIYDFIGAEESAAALRWFQGLNRAILSLSEHPGRCAITRTARISREEVEVLHVRHGAQQEFAGL